MKQFFSYVKGRVRADKILTAIVFVFIAFCVGSGIYFGVIGQARNCVMSFAYLLVVPVIYAVEYGVRLRFAPLFMAILLFLIAGGILGSAYDLYNYIPRFDEILHGISGVIFAVLGFSLMKALLGKEESNKNFFICLFVGLLFSLSIALLWEMFEYAAYAFFGIDMQEDMLIDGFSSYLLMGTHNATEVIDGITQTVIYYADGTKVILGGYLDVGLFDTLNDMLVCLMGGVVYIAALLIDHKLGGRLRRLLVPETNAFERAKRQKKGKAPAKEL